MMPISLLQNSNLALVAILTIVTVAALAVLAVAGCVLVGFVDGLTGTQAITALTSGLNALLNDPIVADVTLSGTFFGTPVTVSFTESLALSGTAFLECQCIVGPAAQGCERQLADF